MKFAVLCLITAIPLTIGVRAVIGADYRAAADAGFGVVLAVMAFVLLFDVGEQRK